MDEYPRFIAIALAPLSLFVLGVLVLNPIKRLIQRTMKDGPIKRLLLLRVN